ncbi:MAG: hypothetical protein QF805_01055, partial [Pirellulaceae bacterium]|nr:hypothetical protein [Pirellulaceae bacterium]
AGSSGSPVLKHGPIPPAAAWGVNAPGFGNRALVAAAANCWNAVARGGAGMERWLQLDRLVHPCSSTGLFRLRRLGA